VARNVGHTSLSGAEEGPRKIETQFSKSVAGIFNDDEHQALAALTSGKKIPDTYRIAGGVGPRADLNNLEKRKYFNLVGIRTLSSPAPSLVAIPACRSSINEKMICRAMYGNCN
jgi:hypothetical protein